MPINSLLYPSNVFVPTGYDVDNSLRFNDDSQDSLTRTPSSASNRRTWTFSAWVKRGNLGADQIIFSGGSANTWIRLLSSDKLEFNIQDNDESTIVTTQLFRDISAWSHIVVAIDTTQGTASNRIKFYVNGNQVTSFSTSVYVSQNYEAGINNTGAHYIGRLNYAATQWFDGYMSEVCFIDGQQLAPTSFGEFDSDSGIWKPKNVSGLTFGTNGFYLEFKGSGTGTNASGMGADTSGNTNHFAVNNLTAVDQSTDTCTNNFCTINPLDNFYSGATFSEGNIKVSSARYAGVTSTFALTKGKWYFEYKCVSRSGTSGFVGITSATATATNYEFGNQSGENVGYSVSLHNGSVYGNGGQVAASGTFETINGGDFGMVALDFDNNKMYFGRNGTWGNSQNPANGTNALSIVAVTQGASGHWRIYVGGETNNATVFEMNFGSPPYAISSGNTDGDGYGNFEYEIPSGYYSLNTKNLAEYG